MGMHVRVCFFYIPLHWVSVKYGDDDDEMTFFVIATIEFDKSLSFLYDTSLAMM